MKDDFEVEEGIFYFHPPHPPEPTMEDVGVLQEGESTKIHAQNETQIAEQESSSDEDEISYDEDDNESHPIPVETTKKKKKGPRNGQNYIRGLSRRLLTTFETARLIQP